MDVSGMDMIADFSKSRALDRISGNARLPKTANAMRLFPRHFDTQAGDRRQCGNALFVELMVEASKLL